MLPSLQDWKDAVRRAIAHPAHSAVVILILALSIAVNSVVFSVADSALFRGLPYPNGPRLVEVFNMDPAGKFSFPGLTPEAIAEWRTHADVFEAVEGFAYANFVLLGGGEPRRIGGMYVTPGLFASLGVPPSYGRPFDAADGAPGRESGVAIGDGLARQQFGAAAAAIGRVLTLNDRAYTVVAVMPPHFRFPASQQQVWVPMSLRDSGRTRIEALAILAPGLTQAMAQARLNTLAEGLAAARPQPAGWRLKLARARGINLARTTERALRILTAAVLIVLLIACANLANLGVAEAIARHRELAVRAALGASRWRLIRTLLTEHLVLAIAGGLAGLALAVWGVGLAIAVAPTELTVWTSNEIRIDARVLGFTAAATFASALLFGVLPAWRASRAKAGDALKSRTSAAAAAHGRLRSALVLAEVALSVVLLTAAALLARSFLKLTQLDPGFDPAGLVTVSLDVPTDRYPQAARRTFLEAIAQRVRRVPGVTAVSIANGVPTSGGNIHFGQLQVEGGAEEPGELTLPDAVVDPGYFETLRIPILSGRSFAEGDSVQSAVVSRSFADKIAPAGGAVGRRFRLSGGDWYTVIGVAGEVHQSRRMERDTSFEIYTPLWRPAPRALPTATARGSGSGARSFVSLRLIVRASNPAGIAAPIKAAIWTVDAAQPAGDVVTVADLLATSLSEDRFATVLMGAFAVLALLLSAAGLYAVLAQLVAQRRHEIGIRMALGASAAHVARLIVGRGVGLTAIGAAAGLAGAWAAARLVASQLYEVAPHDPISFVAVPLILLTLALLASWLPARRALSVDPVNALRAE